MKKGRKEGKKKGIKEIQSDSSRGGRTICVMLFFPLDINEAAHKFEERYLREN